MKGETSRGKQSHRAVGRQKRRTHEGVRQADGLGGDGHPEAPPIRRDDGRLTGEAVHRVHQLSRVAPVVLAGHVGDVVRADGGSLPLEADTHTGRLSGSCYGYAPCFAVFVPKETTFYRTNCD